MPGTAFPDNFGARRQISLVALGIAILCAVMGLIYVTFLRTDYVVLLSRLRPADAAAVVAQLQKDKTPYRLADKGTTILVPKDLADPSRLEIVSTDIPLKGAVGFELFNKSDMGLTDFAQKINYQRALQGELARTIMTLDGVDSARVHLSLPEQGIFQRDHTAAKASVTVIMQPGDTLSPAAVNGIQNLVASAVADLDANDVVVLDARGDVISAMLPVTSQNASPVIQQKLAIEQYYAGKIREALNGSGQFANAQVTVLALFDPLAPAPAPAPSPGGSEAAGPADNSTDMFADSFSPTGRHFGLRAMLTFPQPLGQDDARKVLDITRAAIGFEAAKGDEIRFGIPVRTTPLTPDTVMADGGFRGDVVAPPAAPRGEGMTFARGFWLALGLGVVVVFVVFLAPRVWTRRLSSNRKRDFAARLARELELLERKS